MTTRVRQRDRAQESSTSTGTGGIVVAGATDGAITFTAALADGELCHVAFEHDTLTLNEWEVALCSWAEGTVTLTRLKTIASSNAGAAVNFSAGAKTVFLVAVATHASDLQMFGSGTTDTTISSPTTLAANTWYGNLTIQNTYDPDGYIFHVAGVLDLDHASARIHSGTLTGNNASGATGGGSKAGSTAREWGGGTAGGAGATGGTGVGPAGSAGTTAAQSLGSRGGTGGAGGAGVSAGGGGGVGGVQTLVPNRGYVSVLPSDWVTQAIVASVTPLTGGTGGGGGGAGGAGGGNNGRGGGSGAGGPRFITCFAAVLKTGASTPAGAIQSKGGTGGVGASVGLGTLTGAGGGGGGSGGGFVLVIYGYKIGAAVTDLIQATGGTGGAGGTSDFGTNGTGGTGGTGGQIRAHCLSTGESVFTTGSAGSAGSGTTGGAGGASNATL